MVSTLAVAYLGGWLITTPATFVTSRRFTNGPTAPLSSFGLSVLAGLAWPLMLVGVVELTSIAVYSAAASWRRQSQFPDSWNRFSPLDQAVAPLR